MVKKVLIMSASTGGGHNRAAMAIKENLESRSSDDISIQCEIIDSLKLVNNTMDKLISRGYEKSAMYTPKAYGKVYRLSEYSLVSRNEFKDNPLTSLMARKFKSLLKEKKPDLIIGTHPFPMIALSTIKNHAEHLSLHRAINYPNIPPMMSILTDYTTHSTWIQHEIDYYIVGHEFVKELLIEDDVPSNKIFSYGIPIEKSFFNNRDRDTVLSELDLDPNKFTILLMGGSFGAGNIKETLDDLISIDRDFQVIVIAGKNASLKDKILKKLNTISCDKKVCVLGYTNKMNDILASIDLLITKPGGLTTTEALLKGIPMIIPYYIPGQEEENLDFLTNCGAAIRTTKKFTLPVIVKVLIDDPARLSMLKINIESIRKTDSANNISNLVISSLQENK